MTWRVCRPGGHLWDYYTGTQHFHKVIATHLKNGTYRCGRWDFNMWNGLNSLWSGASHKETYILVKISLSLMVWWPGDKPLPNSMLIYYTTWKTEPSIIQVRLIQMHLGMPSAKCWPFCLGQDMLKESIPSLRSWLWQPWPKTRYQFIFYHGTTKLTLNYESLSSQTASQLSKFKGQSHCKHWVTWPDCFATPSNHCDVTAGLVSLNYVDTLEKNVTKYTMIQREYEEEDTENILLTCI